MKKRKKAPKKIIHFMADGTLANLCDGTLKGTWSYCEEKVTCVKCKWRLSRGIRKYIKKEN